MQLISPFASLIRGGVILNLKIAAAGGDNIQLDILPRGKDSATGVALPPKALVGSAQELDAHLEEYLRKYAASLARLADLVASADAELKTMEDAARAQARKAVDEKGKPRPGTGKPAARPPAPAARRDMSAGLVEDDGGAGAKPDEEEGDAFPGVITTGGAAESAAASPPQPPAGAGDGMSQALFV
jgi:PRTRC genetic system protein E